MKDGLGLKSRNRLDQATDTFTLRAVWIAAGRVQVSARLMWQTG